VRKETKKFNDATLDILLGDNITVHREGKEITFNIPPESKANVLAAQGKAFLGSRQIALLDTITKGSVADKAGIKQGDKIISVNGKSTLYWREFVKEIQASKNKSIAIAIDRNGNSNTLNLTVPENVKIGVSVDLTSLNVTDEYGFLASIPAGYKETIKVLTKQIKQFKILFNTKTKAYKSVKGPIGIVEMMPQEFDWSFFWRFMAMFSVWLAFVNILPIPALDGGHVMFLLYEIISGRPPSEKVLERGQIIGFVIIMGLMAVVFGNDIWNIIKRFI